MTVQPHKLGILGDWRSGRSSVVEVLSGKPCPNHPGIQVTRWTEPASGVVFDVWDVNSRSALEPLGQTFIQDSEALVAVADATRVDSIRSALLSLQAAAEVLGPRPAALLLNKSDLAPNAELGAALPPGVRLHRVSAKQPDSVLTAFAALAADLRRG